MTEQELRQKCVDMISGWIGAKKGSEIHHFIIDTYNSKPSLPRKVRMSYAMDWCAATVSAVGILAGLSDIMPAECSCGELIKLYQKLGRWVEQDGYVPAPGDLIIYSWQDDGVGECVTGHDHVGMVAAVDGDNITVVEGNMGSGANSRVGTRRLKVDGRYIRGYCCPDFAAKGEDEMKLYRYVNELPYGQASVTKAIQNGYIKLNEDGSMGLWEPNIQTIVILDRAGVLDDGAREVG